MDQVTLETALLELGRAGHAAHALYVASNLERSLEELIALRMPNLSNTLKEQLFTGYGPLSSFSARIDIAFALDLIPANLRRDLHAIRHIRNHFAHATERVHFDSPKMEHLLKKFTDYTPGCDRLSFYLSKLDSCDAFLSPRTQTLMMANILMSGSSKGKRSRGK